MNINRLDLNLLRTLDVLLEEMSVTRAAQRLHRSPAAVSEALGRLRDFFEDELLVRAGRQMVPTPLAESLAGPVRQCLIHIQATIDTRPDFEPARSRRQFRLMLSDYVATVIMPDVLCRLQREAPGVTIDMLPHFDEPWAALDRGDFDALVVPKDFMQEGHPWQVLFEDSYVCAVWAGNSLVGDRIDVEQFLALGHVRASFGAQRTPVIEEWILRRMGIERRIEVVATTFNNVPQLLVGTTRIATLHRRLANYYARLLPLRLLPPPVELPPLVEIIQWHTFHQRDPALRWLLGVMREVVAAADRASAAAPSQ